MTSDFYLFFNFAKMQWNNALSKVLKNYAIKYSFFRTSKKTFLEADVPISITVTSGPPPTEITQSLQLVSERFYGSSELFRVDHQLGTRRWTSWVQGINSSHVKIWYHFPWYNRTKPVSWFSTDLLICFHVIEPILEYKLQELGVITLHAGGAVKNGKALLMCGRGQTRKTSLLLQMLRNGWHYLADDLIFLKDGIIYPNPQSPALFDYLYLNKEDESFSVKDYPGMFIHLLKDPPISYSIAHSSKLEKVILLLGVSATEVYHAEFEDRVTEKTITKIEAIDRLERLNKVDYDDALGRFMLQLNQVEGNDCWNQYWQEHNHLLKENLISLPCKYLLTTKHNLDECMQMLNNL